MKYIVTCNHCKCQVEFEKVSWFNITAICDDCIIGRLKMNERIKNILNLHVEQNPGVKLVKVTTTRWYEIPASSSEKPEDLLQEWFRKCSINRSHSFRDSSLLVEHFNDDQKVVDVGNFE